MPKVLIVEDDEAMAVALSDGFRYEGYAVETTGDGEDAVRRVEEARPDLVVLDVMLPRLSGLDACKRLRARSNDVPIILLTARSQEIDKVLGLKLGADDYVTKPFSFMELLARAEALLRRANGRVGEAGACRIGVLDVDFRRHEARRGEAAVDLSAREFELLRYLHEHRGRVVTRDELLNAVWGYDAMPFTRTVDVHVAKLRKKVEEAPAHPRALVTVHGLGYKLLET